MFRPCCAWQKTSVVLPYRSTEKIRLWKLWNHNNTTLHGQRKHRVHLPFQKKASQFAIFGEFLCCPQLLPLVMYMIKINPRFVSPYTHWHTRRPHAVLTSRIKQNRRSPESVWTEPGGEGGVGGKSGAPIGQFCVIRETTSTEQRIWRNFSGKSAPRPRNAILNSNI